MEPKGSLPCLQVPATPPYPQLDQSNPRPPSNCLTIPVNIILPSTTGPSKWSLSFWFPHQNPECTSPPFPHTCYVHHPSQCSWLDHLNIWWCIYISLSSSLCNFLFSLVTSPLSGRNKLLSIYSQTPSAYVPPSMWATKFHTHTEQYTKLWFCIS